MKTMREILTYLTEHNQLDYQTAKDVLIKIGTGQCNDIEITSFLTVYLMRDISVDELAGFRDALLELCIKVDFSDFDTIDLCGTGGDGKDTFNISTLSSFVVAGAGYKVAKHGNYGVSSGCGSSNVLEFLGYQFSNDQEKIRREVETANITFLHAPLFHPAMKYVGPIRQELKKKTFFNMLGPLVNPSFPKFQAVGVYTLEIARIYSYLMQKTDKQYAIIHSIDGYDEVSLTERFKLITNSSEQVLTSEYFGLDRLKQEELSGGSTVKDSAKIFVDVLENNSTKAQKEVVLANSAVAINCFKPEQSITDCVSEARESIESGKALNALKLFLS